MLQCCRHKDITRQTPDEDQNTIKQPHSEMSGAEVRVMVNTCSDAMGALAEWFAGKGQVIKHRATHFNMYLLWNSFLQHYFPKIIVCNPIDHLLTVTMAMLENQFFICVPGCIISRRDCRREGQEADQESAGESNWPSIIGLQLIHQQTLPMIQTSNALAYGQLATNWE